MRSRSSVVTPGATVLPASASARAAICPATRIFSITSGVCTHGSVPSFAVGLPTYSGRWIDLGTGSVGDTTPADRAERTGMLSGYPFQERPRRRISDRRGPLTLTEPHTTRPVNTTCGVPSAGATLRLSLALPP